VWKSTASNEFRVVFLKEADEEEPFLAALAVAFSQWSA
jgi:hypothetical protein